MKIYKSEKEAEKDVVNGTLIINDDVSFEFNLDCKWHIITRDIKARNIKALNIQSWNILADNIDANDIEFYGYAIAFSTFKCRSIVGGRENAKYLCLDSDVVVTGEIK